MLLRRLVVMLVAASTLAALPALDVVPTLGSGALAPQPGPARAAGFGAALPGADGDVAQAVAAQPLPPRFEPGPDGAPRTVQSSVPARFLPGQVLLADGTSLLLPGSAPVLEQPTGAWSNYLFGNDPAAWRKQVPHHDAVRYPQVLPGLDVVWRIEQDAFRLEVEALPGIDASALTVAVAGGAAEALPDGRLAIEGPTGARLTLARPIAWQPTPRGDQPVDVAFEARPGGFGFRLGATDPDHPLVIDPILTYGSYYGGSRFDTVTDIGRDSSGALYLAGVTRSPDLPRTLVVPAMEEDVFVAKVSLSGSILFATYLGGNLADGVGSGASDEWPVVRMLVRQDDVVLAGSTQSRDFPTVFPLQNVHGGGSRDMFIASVSTLGNGYPSRSTYLGGPGTENLRDLTSGPGGEIVVVGDTDGFGSPTAGTAHRTVPAMYTIPPNPPEPAQTAPSVDGYIAVLDRNLATFLYGSYLGGAGEDRAYAVASLTGSLYAIAGRTASSASGAPNDMPLRHAVDTVQSGVEGFAMVLDTSVAGAGAIVFSTYLGGDQFDTVDDVVAAGGNLKFTVVGRTGGLDVLKDPLLPGNAYGYNGGLLDGPASNTPYVTYKGAKEPQRTLPPGDLDLFLATLQGPFPPDPSAPTLVASTYLGGAGPEGPATIGRAPDGKLVVTSSTPGA
ncbi:MAG TPA: hypothetical protein VFH47_09030, partial [Candidatus Thermoplasmatota archaeon]|nr:hypothetical protein [Candidatus Thermoplasmatota archaeon]